MISTKKGYFSMLQLYIYYEISLTLKLYKTLFNGSFSEVYSCKKKNNNNWLAFLKVGYLSLVSSTWLNFPLLF